MKSSQEVVKKVDGREWQFTAPIPENLEEATGIYGEQGVFDLFQAQLKVKFQNVARNKFDAGETVETVEDEVQKWRPGAGGKTSMKKQATELLFEKAHVMDQDDELKTVVRAAFIDGDFKTVIGSLENA